MKDKYNKINLSAVVKMCSSYREVCRELSLSTQGSNFRTVKKYISLHDIDTSHFISASEHLKNIHISNILPFDEVFKVDSDYSNNTGLKNKLLALDILKYECVFCLNKGFWQDKKLVLQLDHINGINTDNRIENLRLLCPNCHTQTETFCGRHKGNKYKRAKEKEEERAMNEGLTTKQLNESISRRVVERPSKKLLYDILKTHSFLSVGKMYNVSDNTIRKWCIYYNLPSLSSYYKGKYRQ